MAIFGAMNTTLEWIERIPNHQPAWVFFTIFILLAFLAWVKMTYWQQLVQSLQASSNMQVANRLMLANNLLQRQLDNILYGFYFFSFGLLLYILEVRYDLHPYGLQGIAMYLFNVILLSALFFVRMLALNLCGGIFDRVKTFREYFYHSQVFNQVAGLVLLPLLVFVVYSRGILGEVFFYLALLTVLGLFAMRLLRGFIFSFRKEVSVFYMFLYLCALEIAPLLIVYRWFEGIL